MTTAAFFASVRKTIFKRLTQQQVDGLIRLVKVTAGQPLTFRAYMLATSYHETAATMTPITEYGGRKYFSKYDTGKLAKLLGNTPEADGDGFKYRGRGDVQLTGLRNYTIASKVTGVDLVNNPDLALEPELSGKIMVHGMILGWYTGKKLADYLPGNYVAARFVVNGQDDASLIAGYARNFEAALKLI